MREKYFDLMANPGRIEEVLQAGAAKARKLATPFMAELREAVGLRNLSVAVSQDKAAGKKAKGKGARFVSFRDDGGFRFRLLAADGAEVLLSRPLSIPRKPASTCGGCGSLAGRAAAGRARDGGRKRNRCCAGGPGLVRMDGAVARALLSLPAIERGWKK